jgi:hypothetical protein
MDEARYIINENKRARVAKGGDLINGIPHTDRRFNAEEMAFEVLPSIEQMKESAAFHEPIKDKIIFSLLGNHDDDTKAAGNLVRTIFCEKLGIPYGTGQTVFTVKNKAGQDCFKFLYRHKAPGMKAVGKTAKQRRENQEGKLKNFHVDLGFGDTVLSISAHNHQLATCLPEAPMYLTGSDWEGFKQHTAEVMQLPREGQPLSPDARFYGSSGSFYKQYAEPVTLKTGEEVAISGYGEDRGYPPAEIGMLMAKIRDYKVVDLEKITL